MKESVKVSNIEDVFVFDQSRLFGGDGVKKAVSNNFGEVFVLFLDNRFSVLVFFTDTLQSSVVVVLRREKLASYRDIGCIDRSSYVGIRSKIGHQEAVYSHKVQ